MKKSFRFIIPLAVVVLIIALLPLATFAMRDEYTILYYTFINNNKEKLGQDDCDNVGTNPRDWEAADRIGDYQFEKWVVEGNESGGLPTGWSTQNNGRKLVYDPSAPGATLASFHFIAIYKPYVEPETEPEETTTAEELTTTEEPATAEEVATTATDDITKKPTTGDTNNMTAWFIIGGVAIAAIIVAVIFLAKKK